MDRLAGRWLPKPRISHPWPSVRFRVKHPRWEPYAGNSARTVLCGARPVMGVPTAIYWRNVWTAIEVSSFGASTPALSRYPRYWAIMSVQNVPNSL
jgi:hypothetical protein